MYINNHLKRNWTKKRNPHKTTTITFTKNSFPWPMSFLNPYFSVETSRMSLSPYSMIWICQYCFPWLTKVPCNFASLGRYWKERIEIEPGSRNFLPKVKVCVVGQVIKKWFSSLIRSVLIIEHVLRSFPTLVFLITC